MRCCTSNTSPRTLTSSRGKTRTSNSKRGALSVSTPSIEHVHAFTRAVSVGNPREFLQAEKEDQEMAEACKRLIKNCIICWNYLYLSQKLEEIKDTASREAFLDAVAHGSAVAWQHLNLLGEYDSR